MRALIESGRWGPRSSPSTWSMTRRWRRSAASSGSTAASGLLAVGSQGLEYALVAHWRAAGLLEQPKAAFAPRRSSASPASPARARRSPLARSPSPNRTAFATIRLDAARAVDEAAWERELGRAADRALAAIGEGKDPLVFTAAGPDDPAVAGMAAAVEASGLTAGMVNDRVGAGLGRCSTAWCGKARSRAQRSPAATRPAMRPYGWASTRSRPWPR